MSYLKLWVITSVNESDSGGRLNFKKEFLFTPKKKILCNHMKKKRHRPFWKNFWIGKESNHCLLEQSGSLYNSARSHFIFQFQELQTNKIIDPEHILEVIQCKSLILCMRKWRSREAKWLTSPEAHRARPKPRVPTYPFQEYLQTVTLPACANSLNGNPELLCARDSGTCRCLTKWLIKSTLSKR